MIQFNLLPDVKLEYIKAERTKRLAISVSILASAVAVGILILLLITVLGLQKKNLSDLNKDIKTNTTKLENAPNLNKILTVQNQLSSLSGLHDAKPATSRIYGYLGQVTPSAVTVSSATIDFGQHLMTITGNGQSLDSVNTFVDTLKFTTYTADDGTATKAFSDVVLSSFARSSSATSASGSTSYGITLTYDPTLTDITKKVTLTVPQTVTTRSVTEQPSALFKNTGTR